MSPGAVTFRVRAQDRKLYIQIHQQIRTRSHEDCRSASKNALEASLSFMVSKLYSKEGLPHITVHVSMKGSAGQSCGAFLAPGTTIELERGSMVTSERVYLMVFPPSALPNGLPSTE